MTKETMVVFRGKRYIDENTYGPFGKMGANIRGVARGSDIVSPQPLSSLMNGIIKERDCRLIITIMIIISIISSIII
jgi:hypothetical protein